MLFCIIIFFTAELLKAQLDSPRETFFGLAAQVTPFDGFKLPFIGRKQRLCMRSEHSNWQFDRDSALASILREAIVLHILGESTGKDISEMASAGP